MEKIKDFIVHRRACLIPPVLLSARGNWKFTPSNANKSFGTIQADDLAAIIDGQHRLGGLLKLANDSTIDEELKQRPIPFMAVDDMDIAIEKQEFVDINGNQKGVKKSLLVYLEREDNFSAMAALAMMEDEESVFKGRIDTQKKHDWTIFLFGAAKECVDLMFSKNFTAPKGFDPYQDKEVRAAAIGFVLNYWRTVRDAMPEFWADMEKMPNISVKKSKDKPGTSDFDYRLLEETGIRAFSKLAAKLFVTTWIDGIKSPAFELISKYLEKMAGREQVKLVLSKPSKNDAVLKLNNDLKSTGKAGVDAIFIYLESELQQVIQQVIQEN
jgi:DGQHR domain-containing protein